MVVKGFGVRSSKYFLKAGYTGADKTVRRGHNFLQEKVPLHLFVQSRCWHQAANHWRYVLEHVLHNTSNHCACFIVTFSHHYRKGKRSTRAKRRWRDLGKLGSRYAHKNVISSLDKGWTWVPTFCRPITVVIRYRKRDHWVHFQKICIEFACKSWPFSGWTSTLTSRISK